MTLQDLPPITASRLAKSEDLNHHGTLFAGRMPEWVVEVGFMTARAAIGCDPGNLVCVRVHGMDFRRSVPKGSTVVLQGRTTRVGRTSLEVTVEASMLEPSGPIEVTTGSATFVHVVDERSAPHGLTVS